MTWRRLLLALGFVVSLSCLQIGCAQETQSPEATSTDARTLTQNASTASNETRTTSNPSTSRPPASHLELASELPDVVEEAIPAVVGISAEKATERRRSPLLPFGAPDELPPTFRRQPPEQERPKRGGGSGVIVSRDGLVITNHHVVERADEIDINLSKHRSKKAEIVGTDPATDLALLRIEDPPDDLQPLSFGNSNELRLGEPVVAIGNPFGLSGTVTYGIVSAKGRANVGLAEYEDFIQTDAAINPGNSGGALVNMEGELIGINTAILSKTGGYQGVGFAIPSNMAKSVKEKLVEDGEVERGWLGVAIQTLTPKLADAFGLDSGTEGVVVAEVRDDSPADRADLQRGDVIQQFEGKQITSAHQLRNLVARQSPHSNVELQILRNGNNRSLIVELGSVEKREESRAQFDDKGVLEGLVLGEINATYREKFEIPSRIDQGLVVADVERDSPAARTGLRPGDVILEVNRNAVHSIQQFSRAYEQADARVLLLVYRDGETVFLALPKVE